ncbi:MAG: biopolymer transporter ExbD [Myxococcota bacterium]
MASVDGGGGGGNGKKSVDQEIPLVPFIDLLVCCIMFLLATAVWNQLASISANQSVPGQAAQEDTPPPEERVKLILQVQASGYTLASTAGDSIPIPLNGDEYDMAELRNKLQERKRLEPNREDIIVAPEDGVRYEEVVRAMDAVVGEGFPQMSLGDGASLL